MSKELASGSLKELKKLLMNEARQRPVLVVLCGPSHAGKTMFARKLGKNFRIISSDNIRKELAKYFEPFTVEAKVWSVFEAMKCQALKEGDNVVHDACHMSKQARWHSLQGPNGQHKKICVVFDLPLGGFAGPHTIGRDGDVKLQRANAAALGSH